MCNARKDIMLRNIETKRKEKGLKQKDLTRRLGVSVRTYDNWINERTPITSTKLIALSKILDTSIDEMLGINTND